jgi:diacylglycerol kinase (ATP)
MIIAAADKLYPQKTAIVLNPHSGRLRKRMDSIRSLAALIPGAIVREADSLAELKRVVDELGNLAPDHLVIAGGDGTVQALLSHLMVSGRWPSLPLISIVPGGTTNMTATDIGVRGSAEKNLKALGQALRSSSGITLVTRPLLQICQANRPDLYGMFFGIGIIARGAGYFHRHIKKTGLTGESASAIVILRLLAGLLSGRKSAELFPARIRLVDDTAKSREYSCMLLFASTLDRLLLGMRPYWGGGSGPIHTSSIRESPARLWRSLLSILRRNQPGLSEQDGYYSRNNEYIEIIMDDDYIVDGEFFRCDSLNGPLRISGTRPVRFLIP